MALRPLRPSWVAIGLLAMVTLLLAGCSGAAMTPSSWPGVSADSTTAYIANNQAVYAVDLATGAERWRFPAQPDRAIALFATPTLTDDGLVILGGFNRVVYALKASDGSVAWQFAKAKDRYIGGAAVAGELVLVPCADHTLYALQRASGALVWSFKT
ncbi:MAG: PQQ-binding-like beta-propeller repeat protein, partial [Anaerolineales bacterium]|nr:PQQ-binding-like beta-propeller repeat protein [Anaerolineales bacterium]